MSEIPVTSGETILFDAPDLEADDHDETWWLFELFQKTVGK